MSQAVKILDFGLAKIKSGELLGSFIQAQTTGLMGSPYYMAPEQWADDDPDSRSDIYSLGVIAYQMLAGEPPFEGNTSTVMRAHRESQPKDLHERDSKIPKRVAAVVMGALAKNPAERPQTAFAFGSALRGQSEGVGALYRRAFSLYSEYFPKFMKLSLMAHLPMIITTIAVVGLLVAESNLSRIGTALKIVFVCVSVIIGLLLTAALTRSTIRGFRFFRTTLFLPQLIAGVVIAQAWTWVYATEGPLNRALELVGLGSLTRPWLGDFTWALPSIGAIGTWVTFGLCMVLFIAGVQKIPTSLYDAARVDGAGAVREFFAVTLPGLRGEILVAFVLTTINALRSFDIVYNTTAGGPGGETLVPSLYMYQNAFLYNRVGYAAAIATVLAVTIFVLAAIVLRIGSRGDRA